MEKLVEEPQWIYSNNRVSYIESSKSAFSDSVRDETPHTTSSSKSANKDREKAVQDFYENELVEAMTLRMGCQNKINDLSLSMISSQEHEIKTAFQESNIQRAKLKIANDFNRPKTEILHFYAKANLKEMSGRSLYARMVQNSAQYDADKSKGDSQRQHQWELRCQADELVVQELQKINDSPEGTSSQVFLSCPTLHATFSVVDVLFTQEQRVKLSFDLNRAKAILKVSVVTLYELLCLLIVLELSCNLVV
jgi:hypothetical protein